MKLKNIKDSFNNRKIEPSASAWDQLAARLDQEEKSNKKPAIYWLSAVAAAIVLGMILYPFFNSDLNSLESQNEIVVEENQETKESIVSGKTLINLDENNEISIDHEITFEENISKTKKESPNKLTSIKNTPIDEFNVNNTNKVENIYANQNDNGVAVNEKESNKKANYSEDNSIDPAIDNAIAQNKPQAFTAEDEMELLLNEALKNTIPNVISQKEINVVQLLRETEWDIEAERRNNVNDLLHDRLGRLKAEAITLIGGNK